MSKIKIDLINKHANRNDKLSLENIIKHMFNNNEPCTGGRRVTFTRKQWDELEKVYKNNFL